MKKKQKNLGQDGFTLAELMVVVGIVGILSSVAIPQYEKYRIKSINAEAYVLLSGLQVGANAFYAEYDTYATCLETMGIVPSPGPRYFSYGFTAHDEGAGSSMATAVVNGASTCLNTEVNYYQGNKDIAGLPAPTDAEVAAISAFTVVAGGTSFNAFAASGHTMLTAQLDLMGGFMGAAHAAGGATAANTNTSINNTGNHQPEPPHTIQEYTFFFANPSTIRIGNFTSVSGSTNNAPSSP